jgi:hypothetical protein
MIEFPEGIAMNAGKRCKLDLCHPPCPQEGGKLTNDHWTFPSCDIGGDSMRENQKEDWETGAHVKAHPSHIARC